MKIERLSMVLALANLLLLMLVATYVVARPGSTLADAGPPLLRGRGLEIVDEHGRVRASITVLPASSTPAGKPHPETVLLRLIDPNGRPGVKIGASEESAGLSFVGESDRTLVILKAEQAKSSLKLADEDGRERLLEP